MNDAVPVLIFAQQVNGLGKAGDVFLGISTSGNSKNVLYAAVAAKSKGLKVIGLTGQNENRLETFADVCIHVPETETYKIQELHLPVYHCLCLMLEENSLEIDKLTRITRIARIYINSCYSRVSCSKLNSYENNTYGGR